MTITDPIKREIAARHLLRYKICRNCGAKAAITATKCRRCHSKNLRLKKQELRR
ncbi:50S ribosomal protein L40e [Candidatus Marsarchaeota G2 archaeon ECH_B_SAG-G16]|jgi:LSU ribosomal protein L40E|uniref:50S ribosomal protein L40e n=5 Tax=Candidatus Marsarchaeota TaxID=1978152 RepID=A0A2R6BZ39_9ARCH|nr:MAG: 50S ribosomal protein L40e [Candidatus Marsarchaeota G1 archaeon OSP_D]PSN85949.1 MAG: 50S ribosomal protein L40e [Candidatus Marsarchaeota G1 archaeon BE_D]PSN88438.1 MAG: 50S ribosomal protein L40e [Candidatus Marsarchaeota G1 archaeon OSP_C]PSO03901.1 MAG: 50S ribosomal protein L40e [Candidatus Marsarchaeota G2 archaeon ECH_B_SAG-G06]PSO05791.1 MAG: 50S ribosomal protein L40e [Candidatus Marsarchaeota G2 archaeon ECH_B_SAG-G16]